MNRRALLRAGAAWAVAAAPWAAGGAWTLLCLRSAWPEEPERLRLPVGTLRSLQSQTSVVVRTPAGRRLTVVRRGAGKAATDYVALSSRCPHLGCRLIWNGARQEHECPCHQARFDAGGAPLAGPPLVSGTPIPTYPLVLEGGMLFLVLTADEAAAVAVERPS